MVHETMKSSLLWSIGGVGLIAGGIVALSYWNQHRQDVVPEPVAMSVEAGTSTNGFIPTATDPWERAKEFGWEAAVATQTAASEADWRRTGDLWLQAIAELERVPQDSPQRAEAQAKIQEYLKNFDYAEAEKAKVRPASSNRVRGFAAKDIKSALSAEPMQVKFSNESIPSEQNSVVGTSGDGRATVELFPAGETVAQVKLHLPTVDGSKAVSMGNVVYTNQFLGAVSPGVARPSGWITRNLRQADDSVGQPVVQQIGNHLVTITTDGQTKRVTVAVSLGSQ